MKIVYLSSSLIPSMSANSIHVMKMCHAFAKNGHEVVLFSIDNSENMRGCDIYKYYGVDDLFEIRRLVPPLGKGRTYVYGVMLAKKVAQQGADMIYSRNLAGSFFSSFSGVPMVFESHAPIDNGQRNIPNILNSIMLRRLIQVACVKRFVVITKSLCHYYGNRYPRLKDRLFVASDAADHAESHINKVTVERGKYELLVGYVGSLYRGKGIEIIIEIARKYKRGKFCILGGTADEIACWRSQCIGIDNIFFLGHVAHGETINYMKQFDILLLPNQQQVSVYGGDGNIADWTSPLKAFEYMSAKKPIICSDLPVLQEVFSDGENALICRHNVVADWIDAMERIRRDAQLKNELANKAYSDFVSKYTWRARAKRVLP